MRFVRIQKNNRSKCISLHIVMNRIGIDIFSGAGGLSLGAEFAGINVVLAIEKEPNAAKTFCRNHSNVKMICDDISNINPSVYVQDDVFVVFGGPPCQGFSTSNTQTRTIENPNNSLFKEFVRFVRILNPEWFVFENVEGIKTFNNGDTLKYIIACFEDIGYTTNYDVLYASDYGVPQRRNRFFLVGNKNGIKFEFPTKYNNQVSVSDAIDDLPDLENGEMSFKLAYKKKTNECSPYARLMRKYSRFSMQNYVSLNKDYVIERYKYIGQGENWKSVPIKLMNNYTNRFNCHSGIYKRLEADKPSVVISNYRKNMLIHPFQNRGLSVREAARLQSFPDRFIFEGSLMHIQQQIGNAVPPLLAKAVFKKIMYYESTIL